MSAYQTAKPTQPRESTLPTPGLAWTRPLRRVLLIGCILLVVLFLSGAGTPSTSQQLSAALSQAVSGWTFNLARWEINAVAEKLAAAVTKPARTLSNDEGIEIVHAYLDRAHEIARLESEIEDGLSLNGAEQDQDTLRRLQSEVDDLRAEQQAIRPTVEQVIEQQVGAELAKLGLTAGGRPFPPVQFTFTEPPKKMVVSPRHRIATVDYRMLVPEFSAEMASVAETAVLDEQNRVAYVTNIGGLGAYPSMVVDRASLPWVLSTVAHEWTHNYLTLFPLGLSYNVSSELTIINETVAEIVGNEVGMKVLESYYPDLLPPSDSAAKLDGEPSDGQRIEIPPSGPMPFDFRTEMRRTRLVVDQLLAEGKVETAETYMAARRQFFVAHGYPLRVLNQAYFAFHGSYGTSPSSTNPLAPKLFQLRAQVPDVQSFLKAVRGIRSAEGLERALRSYQVGED
jgi:hypothetical protein